MAKGNINSALKLLTNSMENGILLVNKNALSKLIQKYPKVKKASQDILLNAPFQNIHSVKFQSINEEMTRKTVIRTKGDSGPSGMDAGAWRVILSSKNFVTSNSDLCKLLANIVQ